VTRPCGVSRRVLPAQSAFSCTSRPAHLWNPGDTLPDSLAFLEGVAALQPAVAAPLREFTGSLAEKWGLEPQLQRVRTVSVEPAAASGTAYLVLQFDPYGIDENQYLVSHWYQWASPTWHSVKGEDHLVPSDRLEGVVERVVLEMERRWSTLHEPVTVEFVLPWNLLNAPVDAWRKEIDSDWPTPLGMDYPIVVRSLDRLRSRQWHRQWHARWRRVLPDAEAVPFWSRPVGTEYPVRLEAELKADEVTAALVLSEPPVPGSIGQLEVRAALRAGVPIVIWHRTDCGAPFREAVAALFRGEGLARLPTRARELRQQAWRQEPQHRETHLGRHLTLLWDDPDRQPEPVGAADDFEGEVR
jgi:hypothetical protein